MCPCEHVFLHQFKYIWLIFLRNYYKRKPHRQQFNICKTSLSKITLWGAFLKHVFKSSVFSFEFFFFNKRIEKSRLSSSLQYYLFVFLIIQPTSFCHSGCLLHSVIPSFCCTNVRYHSIDVLWLENNIKITMKNIK